MGTFGSVKWIDVALVLIYAVYFTGYFFERGGPVAKQIYRRGLFVGCLLLIVHFSGRVFL